MPVQESGQDQEPIPVQEATNGQESNDPAKTVEADGNKLLGWPSGSSSYVHVPGGKTLSFSANIDNGPVVISVPAEALPGQDSDPGQVTLFATLAPEELAAIGVCMLRVWVFSTLNQDQFVAEEILVLNEQMFDLGPYIEAQFNLAPGEYFVLLTLLDCDHKVVDACNPVQTETFEVVSHYGVAVKADMVCTDEASAPGLLGVQVDVSIKSSAIQITKAVLSKVTSWTYRAVHAYVEALCPNGTCKYQWWVLEAPESVGLSGEYLLLNTDGPDAWLNLPAAGTYTLKVVIEDDSGDFNWFIFNIITAENKPGEQGFWSSFQCDSQILLNGAAENKAASQVFDQYVLGDTPISGHHFTEIGFLIPAEICDRSIQVQLDSAAGTSFLLKQPFAGGGPIYFTPNAVGVSNVDGLLAQTPLVPGAAYLMLVERNDFITEFVATVSGGCCGQFDAIP